MSTLAELKGPTTCPACSNAEVPRMGFLRKIMTQEEGEHIIGHSVHYECQTCYALFEVVKDEL